MNNPKQHSLSILGVTGSIGTHALRWLESLEHSSFRLVAVTAMDNVKQLADIAIKHRVKFAAIGNFLHAAALESALAGTGIACGAGEEALIEAASIPVDTTLSAIVGAAGLNPTLAAIRNGGRIALANKECLVCAGDLMLAEVQKYGATLLPVDSEHNAIYQVFDFEKPQTVESIILTASGGPFRTFSLNEMRHVQPEQALKHPNWSMGAKITIDSATMMNKGLELIEAYYLFPVKQEQIEIIVHPESVIHSMVRYRDGSTLAQMGTPDMTIPIAYALSYPERLTTKAERLDFAKIGNLSFEAPDLERFPTLRLAREALIASGSAPVILNAANEIAVEAFLQHKINFLDIPALVDRTLQSLGVSSISCIDEILEADAKARRTTEETLTHV